MVNSTLAGDARRVVAIVAHLAGTGVLVVPGTAAGEGDIATCEPRANTDLGRLNIAVEPDRYGFSPPCTPNLDFYIARNTPLRSIDVVIRVSTRDNGAVGAETAGIDLERTGYGMFVGQVDVDSDADHTCRRLSVDVEIDNCRGGGAEVIECPEIRVKAPKMFAGLSVSGENLNICHDN